MYRSTVEDLRRTAEAILSNSTAERLARSRGYVLALDPATDRTCVMHRLTNARFDGSRAWVRAAAQCVVEDMR